jgi:multidrug resistance efflux pump
MPGPIKITLTAIIVLAAAGALGFKYWDDISNPWTRDGQVRANVIQVASRVSGPIVKLAVKDNQFVKAGDMLFEIDPRTYQAALDQAAANLDQTRDDNAQLRGAKAALETGQLNLDCTRVKASVDGYITNLNLRLGSQAVANQPVAALVDTNS